MRAPENDQHRREIAAIAAPALRVVGDEETRSKGGFHFERGDHAELAAALLGMLESDAKPVASLGALHTYSADSGTWIRAERSHCSRKLQGIAGAPVWSGPKPERLRLRASDVKGAIELAHDLAGDPTFFDSPSPGLAFANGFVRVTARGIEIAPHSPEHAARFSYPFAFDPDAGCTRWLAFLDGVFRDDGDKAEKIRCLQEFTGAALLGVATKFQKVMLLLGEGANGKSTFAEVLAAIFPPGSTCAVAPQTWGQEYRLALMSGKLLNVVCELPEADILAGDSFKAMIDGKAELTGRQPTEKAYSFKPRAAHLFAANRLFGTSDHSFGFWRRWTLIMFNRVFGDGSANPNLAEEIKASELAGIVAWALVGAARLMSAGAYTHVPSSDAALARWRVEANPVASFLSEKTRPIRSADEHTPAMVLFTEFDTWAKARNFRPMSTVKFAARMKGEGLPSERGGNCDHYPVVLLKPGEQRPEPDVEREAIRDEPRAPRTSTWREAEGHCAEHEGQPIPPCLCPSCRGCRYHRFDGRPGGCGCPAP